MNAREHLLVLALSILALLVFVRPTQADPWPVNVNDDNSDAISQADLSTDQVWPEPAFADRLPRFTISVLREPIRHRQAITSTFGEPRGSRGEPPPTYLHNGADVRAPGVYSVPGAGRLPRSIARNLFTGTQVFTITGGVLRHEDFEGTPDVTDYESALVGPYRYMHVKLPSWLAWNYKQYDELGARLVLPAGALIGSTMLPDKFPPHLHLQREIGDRTFANPLPYLKRWSDASVPQLIALTSTLAYWNKPAVRVVGDFDSQGTTAPTVIFPELIEGEASMPIVTGRVDVLARVNDLTFTVPDPNYPNDTVLGGKRVAPVDLGFSLLKLPHGGSVPQTVIPTTFRIDFNRTIPFGSDPKRPERPPETIASNWFFRKIYWENQELGTKIVPGAGVERMDFIVTNGHHPLDPTTAVPDFIDTDTVTTRNSRYRVEVVARDVGASIPGCIGTTARIIVLCNKADVTGYKDLGTQSISEVQPSHQVELTGINFFTALPASPYLEPPLVELQQVDTTGVTRTICTTVGRPTGGYNEQGTLTFGMPTAEELKAKSIDAKAPYFVAVDIRCAPDMPETDQDPLHRTRGVSRPLRIAQGRPAWTVAFMDGRTSEYYRRLWVVDAINRQPRIVATTWNWPPTLHWDAVSVSSDLRTACLVDSYYPSRPGRIYLLSMADGKLTPTNLVGTAPKLTSDGLAITYRRDHLYRASVTNESVGPEELLLRTDSVDPLNPWFSGLYIDAHCLSPGGQYDIALVQGIVQVTSRYLNAHRLVAIDLASRNTVTLLANRSDLPGKWANASDNNGLGSGMYATDSGWSLTLGGTGGRVSAVLWKSDSSVDLYTLGDPYSSLRTLGLSRDGQQALILEEPPHYQPWRSKRLFVKNTATGSEIDLFVPGSSQWPVYNAALSADGQTVVVHRRYGALFVIDVSRPADPIGPIAYRRGYEESLQGNFLAVSGGEVTPQP